MAMLSTPVCGVESRNEVAAARLAPWRRNDAATGITPHEHSCSGTPNSAVIQTYNDHRIAMSFAVAGLKTPGVIITDPDCVAKSFPDFWEFFHRLYRQP